MRQTSSILKSSFVLSTCLLFHSLNLDAYTWHDVQQGLLQSKIASHGKVSFTYDANKRPKKKTLYVLEEHDTYISYATEGYSYTHPDDLLNPYSDKSRPRDYFFCEYSQFHRELPSKGCRYTLRHTPSHNCSILSQQTAWYARRDLIVNYSPINNDYSPVQIIIQQYGSNDSPIESLFKLSYLMIENRLYHKGIIHSKEFKNQDNITTKQELYVPSISSSGISRSDHTDRHGNKTGETKFMLGPQTPGNTNSTIYIDNEDADSGINTWEIAEEFRKNNCKATYKKKGELIWKTISTYPSIENDWTKEVVFYNKNNIEIGQMDVTFNEEGQPLFIEYAIDSDYFEQVKEIVLSEIHLIGLRLNTRDEMSNAPVHPNLDLRPTTIYEEGESY